MAVSELSAAKHRNAGQVCVSPTRFLVEKSIFAPFVEKFVEKAAAIKVGDGMMQGTMMGPLANRRRLDAMDELVADAAKSGAEIKLGGRRFVRRGEVKALVAGPRRVRAADLQPGLFEELRD